jgi:hypothetical protein
MRSPTRSASGVRPTTLFSQRTSADGNAATRSTRHILDGVLLQVDERGSVVTGSGSRSNWNTRPSRWNTLPTFQLTPLRTIGSPHPRRSKISSVRFAQQIAREPTLTV